MNAKYLLYVILIFAGLPLHAQSLLKDVETSVPGSSSSPTNWSAVNDSLFIFQAVNLLQSNYLFASDGTETGTIGLGNYQVDTDIIRLGDKAFFGGCNIAFGADSCASLYVSDGTVAGTQLFFDLTPGSVSLGIEDIVAGDSLFYFSGHLNNEGYELWRSNGTAAGTYRMVDIATGPESGYRGELAVIDDIAYFAGFTPQHGIEPWRSDGTAAGTYMITDLNDGTASGGPAFFTASGGFIYFSGLGTQTGREVFRTTGAQENIQLIGETGTTDSSNPREFVDSDGTLYYVAVGIGSAGFDLYAFDHGSSPVHIDFPLADIFPRALMPFGNGKVIFNAQDTSGRELWISDGTQAGTKRIIDLDPGPEDGVFGTGAPGESFYVLGDSLLYFAGKDNIHAKGEFEFELFVTDGTAAGTQLVVDQHPGEQGSNPGDFFEFGDRLYYAATDPTIGREPYYLGGFNATFVEPEWADHSFHVYPNPLSNGMPLTLEADLTTGTQLFAQLYDLQGNLLQEVKPMGYFDAGSHTLKIDLNTNHKGICFLLVNPGSKDQQRFTVVLE